MQSESIVRLVQDIVRKRTLAGITQSEVAQAIGVSLGSISRWESSNFSSTKLTDLLALIKYLEQRGLTFDDYKKNFPTYESTSQTTRSAWEIRKYDTLDRKL